MSTEKIQPSFSSGELSPTLYGRVDLAKYHTGLATCRNAFVDYRGGVSSRPGTMFVGYCQSQGNIRLVPFQFNNQQTYILEFGTNYMRVIKEGAYVTEPILVINSIIISGGYVIVSTASPHGYSNGDWLFFANVGGMTKLNGPTYAAEVLDATHFRVRNFLYQTITDLTPFAPWTSGGTVARLFRLITPWGDADLPNLKFAQSADTMTFCHPSYPPYDLTRTAHWIWTLSQLNVDAAIAPPTVTGVVASALGTTSYAYVVTAVDVNGDESVISNRGDLANSVNIAGTAGTVIVVWDAALNAAYYKIYKATPSVGSAVPSGAQFGYVGSTLGTSFVDTNVTPDFAIVPPKHTNPFATRSIISAQVTGGGAGLPQNVAIGVTDVSGFGANLRGIISNDGHLVAVDILSGGRDYTAPTFTIPGGATISVTLSGTANLFPSVVTYYQQRKVFANSNDFPQRFWMSQPGLYKNFDKSNPIKDDDAILADIASLTVNDIKWMIPMQNGIITLTGSSAWQISAGGSGQALTPRTVSAQQQSFSGVSNVQPIVINYNILYVQSLGSVVRDLSYNFFANIYTGADVTILSNHLFFDKQIVSWTYAEEPFKLVWAVRDDGVLLSLTYLKEQEVNGWARHDTFGEFKQAASIVEGNEHAVYFVVARDYLGTRFNFVERLASRNFEEVETSWCLDCALRYQGSPQTIFSNLDHLEGKTIAVVADGSQVPDVTIVNGSFTLAEPASRVLAGFGFQGEGATLRLDTGEPTTQGKRKKIPAVTLRVDKTRGLKIGSSLDELYEVKERTTEIYGAPVPLQTGDERITIGGQWDTTGQVFWQQDGPFPFTILAAIPEFVVGDDDR